MERHPSEEAKLSEYVGLGGLDDEEAQALAEKVVREVRRATTREVALEAGVSEGTIYNYFEGKDALLMAILERLNETERRAEDFEEGMTTDFRGSSKNTCVGA